MYDHLFTSIKKGNHNRNYSKNCNSKEAFSLLIMGPWKIDMWVGGGGGQNFTYPYSASLISFEIDFMVGEHEFTSTRFPLSIF